LRRNIRGASAEYPAIFKIMKLFNSYHYNKSHSNISSDLWNFELSTWLHMIGWSVISIFVPILMLVAGYSLTAVLVYEAIFYLIDVPLNFVAGRLIKMIGARAMVIIATIIVAVYFVTFRFISFGGWSILIALAVLAALYDTFYWVAHLYLFMESSGSKKEISRNNGMLTGIRSFGGMLGPAIGSAILLFGNLLLCLSYFLFSLLFRFYGFTTSKIYLDKRFRLKNFLKNYLKREIFYLGFFTQFI